MLKQCRILVAMLLPVLWAPCCSPGEEGRDAAQDTGETDQAAIDGEGDTFEPDGEDGPVEPDVDDDAAGPDWATDPGAPDADAPHEPLSIRIDDVTVTENPLNVLSYFVAWTTDIPATTGLRVLCPDSFDRTYGDDGPRSLHSVFVMGLVEGASCDLFIEALAGDRHGSAAAAIERVGPLPDMPLLPDLTVTVLDRERIQAGWTILTLSDAQTEGTIMVMVVDEDGRYRWYHDAGYTSTPGAGKEIQIIPEGLLFGAGGAEIILSWEGETLWEAPFDSHHDLRVSPFHESHLLYLSGSTEGCSTREHTVNEFDMDSGETVWTWRICGHYTPRTEYANWSHINTVEPVPGERAVLISSRNQDVLIKIDRDTDQIEWVLGFGGDFEMDDADFFLRQHSPEILPDGHILLFDNGLTEREAARTGEDPGRVRTWSRALELELAFDGESPLGAAAVWDYTDESLFAESRSEADRLPNGNTLITYSALKDDLHSLLLEVTHEREVVWELPTPPGLSTYRSERIEPAYGYVM